MVFKHELNEISVLGDYVHLRYIYLSSNQLAEVGPLSSIKQMLTLILDRNKIEQFNLPKMNYLQVGIWIIVQLLIPNFR